MSDTFKYHISEHVDKSDKAIIFMTDSGVRRLTIPDMIGREATIKQLEAAIDIYDGFKLTSNLVENVNNLTLVRDKAHKALEGK